MRIEDVRVLVDYFIILDFVDNDRIGVFGVCVGGGYIVSVVRIECCIKILVIVSMVDIGVLFCKGFGDVVLIDD